MPRKSTTQDASRGPAKPLADFADPFWAEQFPPLLTPDQAAKLLQVPKATIYDWSSRHLLDACKRRIGKHVRFFRDRLIQCIDEGSLYEAK